VPCKGFGFGLFGEVSLAGSPYMCLSTSKLGCPVLRRKCGHGTWMMMMMFRVWVAYLVVVYWVAIENGSISISISTGYISVFFIYIFVSIYIYIYSHMGQSVYKYKYIYIHPSLSGEKAKYPIG